MALHDAKRLIQQGHERLKDGDRDQAAELYNRARLLDPHSAEAYYGLALVHWRRDVAQAEYWANCARPDPSYLPATMFLSNACFAQGLREEARALQDRAAREAGNDRSLLAQIGFVACAQTALVYEEQGIYLMAEGYLLDGLKCHQAYASQDAMIDADPYVPFLADAHHALARVLQRQRKVDEARLQYQLAWQIDRTIELDPMHREIISEADLYASPSTKVLG